LFGPHDPLGDRPLIGEEGPRDLRRVEAEGDAQRQRDLRRARQRRMATQEDETQLVVQRRDGR
jgi:hypothetical protein